MRLTPKLTLALILYATALLAVVGALDYNSGRESLRSAVISELQATSIEKEAALNAWVEEKQRDIAKLAADPAIIEAATDLVVTLPDSPDSTDAHDKLVAEIQPRLSGGEFLEVMLIDPQTGQVIAATDPSEEGKFKEDQLFFLNGKTGPYVQNLYYSLALQGPAMTAAAPLHGPDGRLLGVLAGRLDLAEMNAIITRRSGLHQTDDAYLVNTSNLFVTQPRLLPDPGVLQRGVHSQAVDLCLQHNNGMAEASDYRDIPAIVIYRWLPEQELCLIVKMDEAEAYAPAQAFGGTVAAISALALLVAALLAVALARSISRPVLALQTGAIRFGRGELDVRLPETSRDELGELAHEFNAMASTLEEKDAQLRAHASVLEQRVVERTAALKQANAYNRSLIEASLDPLVAIGPDGKITDVNAATEAATGYSREELIGTDFSDYFTEPEKARAVYQEVFRGRSLRDYPLEIRHRDGQTVSVLYNASVYRDEEGQIVGIFAAARDITERKRAEERRDFLASASRALVSTLDYETTLTLVAQLAVPKIADWCTVYLTTPDGTIEQVALTHADPEKVKWARELQQRYPPNPNAPRGVAHVIRSGETEFMPEIPAELLEPLKKDPEISRLLDELRLTGAMTVPLKLHEQTLGAISLVSAESRLRYTQDDLELAEELARRAVVAVENARLYHTAQQLNQELEQRVTQRTAQLEATNKELEAFAYSVSHDLRAPLRHIDGFIEMLQKRATANLDDKSKHYLVTIAESAKQMGTLIDDLLTFSRMGRSEMFRTQVDLGTLAAEVIKELRPDAGERNIQWHVTDLPSVNGDRAMLRIVFVNLIANALKFTRHKEQTRIEIVCIQDDPDEVTIFVRDNGVGFDMNYVDKLFNVFQRLHRVEEFEGTGIGLANVRRIINRHGGRTWAEGQVDQGATFYFSLPTSE